MVKIRLDSRTQDQVSASRRSKKTLMPPPQKKGRKSNRVAPMDTEDENEPQKVVDLLKQNVTRVRLKEAVLDCMHAFLDGAVSNQIPLQMLSTCNFVAYATQMHDCWSMRDRSDVAPTSGESCNVVVEGARYAREGEGGREGRSKRVCACMREGGKEGEREYVYFVF